MPAARRPGLTEPGAAQAGASEQVFEPGSLRTAKVAQASKPSGAPSGADGVPGWAGRQLGCLGTPGAGRPTADATLPGPGRPTGRSSTINSCQLFTLHEGLSPRVRGTVPGLESDVDARRPARARPAVWPESAGEIGGGLGERRPA